MTATIRPEIIEPPVASTTPPTAVTPAPGTAGARIAGVALRITAVAGAVLLILMWAAEWPMAQFDSTGAATGSTNPLIDYHIIYALGLVVVGAVGAASSWGLGKWWSSRPIVAAHPALR